jgi:hypothetical protein
VISKIEGNVNNWSEKIPEILLALTERVGVGHEHYILVFKPTPDFFVFRFRRFRPSFLKEAMNAHIVPIKSG